MFVDKRPFASVGVNPSALVQVCHGSNSYSGRSWLYEAGL
jgi:hypothetical protein